MTNLRIKIVDFDNHNETIEIDELTSVGVEMLISECEELLSELKDKYYETGVEEFKDE